MTVVSVNATIVSMLRNKERAQDGLLAGLSQYNLLEGCLKGVGKGQVT